MLEFILVPLAVVRVFYRTRQDNAIEILALRQQLAVLKRKQPRPRLNPLDRLSWLAVRRLWPYWADLLVVAKPQTVVRWHRAGFRLFWKWRSRARGGRAKTTAEIRTLIRRIAQENPSWARRGSTASLRSSASSSPNAPSLATCDVSVAVAARTRVG